MARSGIGPAPPGGRVLTKVTLLLGLFTLLAVVVEDIPARWSSIYLAGIGAPEAVVGIGFTAFTIAMRWAGSAATAWSTASARPPWSA